jgi:alpha,alpha-trehalase
MSDATARSRGEEGHPLIEAEGGFPRIDELAFLSDCENIALLAPRGTVEWFCLPRPDSPSVFGSLLDRTAGAFRLGPEQIEVPSHRRYQPGTLALETTWQTPSGWVVVHDCLVLAAVGDGPRNDRYRRAPGDFAAAGILLRIATCIDGEAEVMVNCLPRFDYGRDAGTWSYCGEGYGDAAVRGKDEEPNLRLTTDRRLELTRARAFGRTRLRAGESMFAALSWGDREPPADVDEAYAMLAVTNGYWREWLKDGEFPDHEWRPHLERSALALKGLSYAPTGAILAAATTSLPETPGGERNWDYRYSWVRDSAFMLWGLFTLGFDWEAYEYYAFISETIAAGPLQIMYGIDGERELEESTLDHLGGYGGAHPVRIGNGAWNQRQHDVWGMLLDSIAIHSGRGIASQFPDEAWQWISSLVESAIEGWPQPDRGIWEIRGEPQHFTASKVMCWVALDRGVKLAEGHGDTESAERWRQIAERIHAEVCERGVDERGVFTQHYDTGALDASLLLIPMMGFLPPDDERVRKTVLAIADELTVHGLVFRYRVETTDDGLSGEEGAFAICSFWLVSSLTMIGELERARALCEKLLSLAGALNLFAEEIDAVSGRHLGNFPQAFTHLSLINAVVSLIRAEEEARPQSGGALRE